MGDPHPPDRRAVRASLSDEEPERVRAFAEIEEEVARLLGGPSTVVVGGDAQNVHVPALTSNTNGT
jgi:hypothetical protein